MGGVDESCELKFEQQSNQNANVSGNISQIWILEVDLPGRSEGLSHSLTLYPQDKT